jgi:hypothetical protein
MHPRGTYLLLDYQLALSPELLTLTRVWQVSSLLDNRNVNIRWQVLVNLLNY